MKCFYCDGGLESWQPEDSPWEEHKKWFGNCIFVQMNKECGESKASDIKAKIEDLVFSNQEDSISTEHDNGTKESELKGPTLKCLEEEIETLREERRCKICYENPASIVFLPCGHLCSCPSCASALKVDSN